MEILSLREAVRRRPGMYFGSVDARAQRYLLRGLFGFALERPSSGPTLELTTEGNVLQIRGFGEVEPSSYTEFNRKTSRADCLGAATVNFVSECFHLSHDGPTGGADVEFRMGEVFASSARTATPGQPPSWSLSLRLDPTIFEDRELRLPILERECRLFAYLNPTWSFILNGTAYHATRGLADLVVDLNWCRESTLHEPIAFTAKGERFSLDIAIQYADTFDETTVSFANERLTDEHGDHVDATRTAIGELLHSIDPKVRVKGRGRPGLTLAVHARIEGIQYEGARRSRVTNRELLKPMIAAVRAQLEATNRADPKVWQTIRYQEIYGAERARR